MRRGLLVALLAIAAGCLEAPDGPGAPGADAGGRDAGGRDAAGPDAGPLVCPGGAIEDLLDSFTGGLSTAWEIFSNADSCRVSWIDDDVEIANDGTGHCGIRSTTTYEAVDGAITLFIDPEANVTGTPDAELRLVIDGDRRVSIALAEREIVGRTCTSGGCSRVSVASGELPERLRIQSTGGRVVFSIAEEDLPFDEIGRLGDPGLGDGCVTVEVGSFGIPAEDSEALPVEIDGINGN